MFTFRSLSLITIYTWHLIIYYLSAHRGPFLVFFELGSHIQFWISSCCFLCCHHKDFCWFHYKAECLLQHTEDCIMPPACQTKLILWTGSKLYWQLATIHQKLKRWWRWEQTRLYFALTSMVHYQSGEDIVVILCHHPHGLGLEGYRDGGWEIKLWMNRDRTGKMVILSCQDILESTALSEQITKELPK